jgi:predicted ester cyclase
MSLEENKALIRRFYEEVWNKGNIAVIDDIFASDYIRHDLRPGIAPPGPEGQKAIAHLFRAAFPDIRMTLDLLIAEGDLVMGRWTTQATHTGEWAGVSPTGKRAVFTGVNIFRIAGGKVVELWNHRDDQGLMEQLGVPVYAGFPDRDEPK